MDLLYLLYKYKYGSYYISKVLYSITSVLLYHIKNIFLPLIVLFVLFSHAGYNTYNLHIIIQS